MSTGTAAFAVRTQESTDESLVAAVRHGDDSAFEELYRRHQPEIGRFVRGRLRDTARAEDVTQEAFVSALRRLRQTDSEISFRPWIFEIARNATIDSYRRASRSEEVSIDAPGLSSADVGRLPGGLQPDAHAAVREQLDYLRGALDELSETHHRVIVMRELEGRSYREIGARMNLSQSAVESTLFRARRRLEHEYAELNTGRRCRLVGAAIARLAEGLESARDRHRVERHARRCPSCCRLAREMGVDPVVRSSIAARAAALLPLPAFLRRRLEQVPAGSPETTTGLLMSPGAEVASSAAGKAVALVVTAVVVGGGGATLGGAGPLALPDHEPGPAPVERPAEAPRAGAAGEASRPSAGRDEHGVGTPALDMLFEGGHSEVAPTPPSRGRAGDPPPGGTGRDRSGPTAVLPAYRAPLPGAQAPEAPEAGLAPPVQPSTPPPPSSPAPPPDLPSPGSAQGPLTQVAPPGAAAPDGGALVASGPSLAAAPPAPTAVTVDATDAS